jgi:hypothetical protein
VSVDPVFHGRVKHGVMFLDDLPTYERHFAGLEGKRIDLIVRVHRDQRTSPQNRYYWGVVVTLLADHLGLEKQELHESLKLKFLVINPDAPLPVARGTSELDTAEFADYVERCRRLAAELGCVIPAPGEVEF